MRKKLNYTMRCTIDTWEPSTPISEAVLDFVIHPLDNDKTLHRMYEYGGNYFVSKSLSPRYYSLYADRMESIHGVDMFVFRLMKPARTDRYYAIAKLLFSAARAKKKK